MLIKAIRFKDVRIGDVVGTDEDGFREVLHIVQDTEVVPHRILLDARGGNLFIGRPTQFIGLLHRPAKEHAFSKIPGYAQREVVQAMCENGFQEMSIDDQLDRRLTTIREAIETYELGKPLAEDECKTGKCQHPKNAVGLCLVWAMSNPSQREC